MFREALAQNLGEAGFQVAVYPDGESALDAFANGERADALILDWKLPGLSGLEVMKRLRETGDSPPALFLTSMSSQPYEEAALVSGAYDFVDKTRSFAIVEKRLRLVIAGLRSSHGHGPEAVPQEGEVEVGDLHLDRESRRATWRGERVDLTVGEYAIVEGLAERAGRDVAARDLYDLVHDRNFAIGEGDDGWRANMRTFVKRIRQKFRAVDPEFDRIETYPGFGYRWRLDGEPASHDNGQ